MSDALAEFIRETAGEPFEWGRCDCGHWAARWVARVCGADLGRLGSYLDADGAAEYVRAGGGVAALVAAALEPLGAARALPAARGDVVVGRIGEHELVGVCTGARSAFKTVSGVASLSPSRVVAAWRLPARG